MPWSVWGAAFAHAGLGVSLMGIAAIGWGEEKIARLKIDQIYPIGPYSVVIRDLGQRPGPNYQEIFAQMRIAKDGAPVATIEPSKRTYQARRMSRTEAGIATLGLGQIYVSFGDVAASGEIDARLYWKPYVTLIWIGGLIMAMGGLLSLGDRRLRIGAPKRAFSSIRQQAAQ
jgi:cytochrome c-type biogenesis protein CcmF